MVRKIQGLALLAFLTIIPSVLLAQSTDPYQNARDLYAAGKFDDALDSARNALQEVERKAEAGSMVLSKPLALLAKIQESRKEYREAAQYLERLRSIQETRLGRKNLQVAETISDLIRVYEKQGDTATAEKLNDLADSRWGAGKTENENGRTSSGQTSNPQECLAYRQLELECISAAVRGAPCSKERHEFLNKKLNECAPVLKALGQSVLEARRRQRKAREIEMGVPNVPR